MRAPQTRQTTIALDRRHRQFRLRAHMVRRTDVMQEREGLAITAEQDVLSVVDQLAGLTIGECRRASSETRPCLEHEHARTFARKSCRGAQAGEAAADDNRVKRGHRWNSHWRSAIAA